MGSSSQYQGNVLKYVLFAFIAFLAIDSIIKFYFFYFLNYETNTVTIFALTVPYVIMIIVIFLYIRGQQKISHERREFLNAQIGRRGLPVRRSINVVRIKKKPKNQDKG